MLKRKQRRLSKLALDHIFSSANVFGFVIHGFLWVASPRLGQSDDVVLKLPSLHHQIFYDRIRCKRTGGDYITVSINVTDQRGGYHGHILETIMVDGSTPSRTVSTYTDVLSVDFECLMKIVLFLASGDQTEVLTCRNFKNQIAKNVSLFLLFEYYDCVEILQMDRWSHIVLPAAFLLLTSATFQDYDEPCHPYACEFGDCIPEGSSFRCECRKDHVGETCNIWRSPLVNCDVDGPLTCFNNGICNTTQNSFTCVCSPNFTGFFCEEDVNECKASPCQNGGTCVNRPGSFFCMCPLGFKGEICDEPVEICSRDACENGGTCIDSKDGYVCHCPLGVMGRRCERDERVFKTSNNDSTRENPVTCADCPSKIVNGKCEGECNVPECGGDDGDCLNKNLFGECPHSSFCALAFRNGICDEICDTEACLFDGFDCMPKIPACPEAISTYCSEHRADGICDEKCNQEGCDFDGSDCQGVPNKILSGELSVVVLTEPSYFVANVAGFLRSMSRTLRADVQIKNDQKGPKIFFWNEGKMGDRVKIEPKGIATRTPKRGKRGVIVWIEVDVAACVNECFSDVEVVASFIEASRERYEHVYLLRGCEEN
ncbi:EGF-like domain protein [Necator americanus]|uniref:EGF-like domain protein n=1 Tax=Necator americanus TaxID=51031 RepID=W2SHU6_NECAM|nr:EGF-like domain protein [Necator americanus]ETN69143.1 EGF-like domain protein [Necator americanus]